MDGKGKNKKKSRKSAIPHLAAITGVLTDQHRNFTTLMGLSPNFPVVTGIKHHFTTFSECPLQEQFFCPGKWRIFRTKRTILKGFARQKAGKYGQPALCRSCPRKHRFLWTDSIKNQLLSMKSWILVDRMQNNRDFTLSRFIHSGSFCIIS